MKKICQQCRQERPITNFMAYATGSRQLASGETKSYDYREDICRTCRRQNRKALGLCMCGQPIITGRGVCSRCASAQLKCVTDRRIKDRAAAIECYGGACAYCGETIKVFLTIDHVNNDGAEHRRLLTGSNRKGHDIGAWLRRNNYPDGFQVLCMNCNHAKGRIGEGALLAILREAGRLRSTETLVESGGMA